VTVQTVRECQAYILVYVDSHQTLEREQFIDDALLMEDADGGSTPGYESSSQASDATGDIAVVF